MTKAKLFLGVVVTFGAIASVFAFKSHKYLSAKYWTCNGHTGASALCTITNAPGVNLSVNKGGEFQFTVANATLTKGATCDAVPCGTVYEGNPEQ